MTKLTQGEWVREIIRREQQASLAGASKNHARNAAAFYGVDRGIAPGLLSGISLTEGPFVRLDRAHWDIFTLQWPLLAWATIVGRE